MKKKKPKSAPLPGKRPPGVCNSPSEDFKIESFTMVIFGGAGDLSRRKLLPTLFVRQDGVEAMWSVVDPIVARWEANPATDFPNYPAGTWGPKAADELLEKEGRTWFTKRRDGRSSWN